MVEWKILSILLAVELFHSIQSVTEKHLGCALSLGNFDGLHIGHRELIKELISKAKTLGKSSVLISFDPHPMKILHPEAGFQRLMPKKDLVKEAEKLGLDALVLHPFTRDFAQMAAVDFFEKLILPSLQPSYVLLGHDFRFGHDREGGFELVQKFSSERGFQLEKFKQVLFQLGRVSSTEVRKCILDGEIERAKSLLGRAFVLYGKVIQGDARGRQIGFPTANLQVENECLPKAGVYITEIKLNSQLHKSVTNIGRRPSFKGSEAPLTIETHIMDFNTEIYGKEVELLFHTRLRDEVRFSDIEQLKKQIAEDVRKGREFFEVLS